ncbi:hypothetical protein Hanom_Chr03g00266361 [Helianthus anomalus]
MTLSTASRIKKAENETCQWVKQVKTRQKYAHILPRFKKTETSFEAFSLRLTRRKPRGEQRRKPKAELKIK